MPNWFLKLLFFCVAVVVVAMTVFICAEMVEFLQLVFSY